MSDARLRVPESDAIGSEHFEQALHTSARLRDDFRAFLNVKIAVENSLDRVDEKHTFESQRGKVAAYRAMIQRLDELERQGANDGPVRKS